MKSDLNLLIEYYRAEKRSLESSIKAYLKEQDYLYAHYQQEALWRLNITLGTLQYFKDPLYYEKQELKRIAEFTKGRKLNSYVKSFYQERLIEKENSLSKKSSVYYFNDDQVIDDALFNLYEGRCKQFRLCLSKTNSLYLYFELQDKQVLNISFITKTILDMYGYDEYNYDEDDNESRPYVLRKLGFKWENDLNKIVYSFNMTGFKDAIQIKILLARIAYEVFSLDRGEYDQETILEYLA
ncbi:hypothetical protein [Mucilaginibacter lappiensis]|uniref:Uncharacterized protein n=1 Tax=Mucilaginibacter lappiensis TaxID=354630 RepID=A0A841JA45_9SPHI|nr:hypothetical protein [Mucilaginibacter lappiensis]MBB6127650.1 hypothetical protein [Mucilaginibacter lappiensis]